MSLTLQSQNLMTQPNLRVMSFNIRYNNPNDGMNAWPHRTDMVASMIRFHRADLVGVQEALHGQMQDLGQILAEYSYIGVGRDDGDSLGEYSAIWYKKSRFEVLGSGTYWLSETPDKPSKGWDANLNRIVTWGHFRDRFSGKELFHFNTHFDHRGEEARRQSAKLVLKKIVEFNPEELPTVITGDFNANPTSEPYRILTDRNDPTRIHDSYLTIGRRAHGPNSSWSGFTFPGIPDRRIDYVFTRHNIRVVQAATLTDSWSGRFPSDHLPVIAEVAIDPAIPHEGAHAHNDYEHENPLFDALACGFTSLEADVHLIDGELYVIHDKPVSVEGLPTLRELYLDPLARIVDKYQGHVYPGYRGPFYLMIDFKTSGPETYEVLAEQLKDYAAMLNTADRKHRGPVKIFISGNRPVELILDDPHALAALDGRPNDLGKNISTEKMPVISTRFGSLIAWRGKGEIPSVDLAKLKELAEQAHGEGKRVRLWASPENELTWNVLKEAGIDFINTDQLKKVDSYLRRQK